MTNHAFWSPSSFHSLMLCPGKMAMEADLPNTTNEHAVSGTLSHHMLTWALKDNTGATQFIGKDYYFDIEGSITARNAPGIKYEFIVDAERAARVQSCIDYVYQITGDTGVLIVDSKVNFARYLGLDENQRDQAWGTLDVAVIVDRTLYVIDYKDGRIYVSVGSDDEGPNPQIALYALGIIDKLKDIEDFDKVVLGISQPKVSEEVSTYEMTVEQLEAWAMHRAIPACGWVEQAFDDKGKRLDWDETYLTPGDKQCGFCRAKATCPARRNEVIEVIEEIPGEMATVEDFQAIHVYPSAGADSSPTWLAAIHSKADMIQDFLKAVDAEIERRLFAGQDVPGLKLVEGKLGNREWTDAAEAEAQFKTMRLKTEEMYSMKLISPTAAEKLAPKFDKEGNLKPNQPETFLGPQQWKKLQKLITRTQGKPHIAPVSDPRPALQLTSAEDFPVINSDPNSFS